MVPVGYTWLRQTFGLLKSELEHESYLGSRASLTHQKNGRKTQKAAESRRRWFYRVFICEICGQKLRFLKSAHYGLLVWRTISGRSCCRWRCCCRQRRSSKDRGSDARRVADWKFYPKGGYSKRLLRIHAYQLGNFCGFEAKNHGADHIF